MTKREWEDYRRMYAALERLGLPGDEVDILSRCAKTLHRWAERECNGEVERDEDTGKTYGTNAGYSTGTRLRWRVADRETGALKRVKTLMAKYPDLWVYHQGDPRGCALYVGRLVDIPGLNELCSYYTRGVAVW